MRARLDGRAAVAGVEHLPEEALQVDRLRRREGRGSPLASDPPLDRPDEPGPATRRVEDRAQQERRRRLPVRPRDARELELLRRLAEERHPPRRPSTRARTGRGAAGRRPRAAARRRPRPRRARSPPTRGRGRRRATPRTQKKSAPSVDASRVVREVADLDRPAPGHLARRESPDQGVELHRPRRVLEQSAAQGRFDARADPLRSAARSLSARPAESRGAGG